MSLGAGVPELVDLGSDLRQLVRALVDMASDTQTTHQNFLEDIETKYGLDQRIYFRFNVDRGLANIALEEWKHFESIEVATRAYIRDNKHRIRSCAESLVHPRM